VPDRYTPDRPFPSYAYLPGRDPHPVRDPRGHSHGHDEGPADYFDHEEWRSNDDYLFGVDLYNFGYLWEAHEAWEGLWHAAKHDALQAELLQGLIQCSAACLKIPMEQPRGLAKLSEIGTGRLARVAAEYPAGYMGLDLGDFVDSFRAFAASEPTDVEGRPLLTLT
jgi:hypothetical protein